MPPAIATVGAYLFMSEIAVGVGLFLMEYATIIGTTLLLATAYSYQQRQKRKMRDAYNAAQVDRLANITTSTGPRELVLGKVRKGGYVLFRDSCGGYKDRFVMVIALANHEIEGVESYYLNDQKVTLDSQGFVVTSPYDLSATETVTVYVHITPTDAVAGTVTQSYLSDESGNSVPYTTYQRLKSDDSNARIRLYTGTQTQTADARLMSLFPGVWTANHTLTGIAYLIVEYIYNETSFPSGMPTVTAVVKGAKVYDPRSGLTAWSDNPALHALHIVQHPYFGKRGTLTERELARVSAAANACDETYTTTVTSASGITSPLIRPMYQSGIVLQYGAQATDVLDDICIAMCGTWAYAGGEFFIKAGKYTAPVVTLTESDLLTSQKDSQGSNQTKQITINSQRSKADRVNTINVKIWDALSDYKETTLSPVVNAEMRLLDGREISSELSLPAVSNASQGKLVANYMLKESVDSLSITASFKLTAYAVELFDNVALTVPRYGWVDKVFMVIGRKFNATGAIELSMREISAEIYNPNVYPEVEGFASNTNLIEPWTIPKPTNLVATSGTSELVLQADGTVLTRVKVQWTAITDARITQGGFVEVQWQEVGADFWNSLTVAGSEPSCHLLGTVDGRNIIIRARTRYPLAVSDWGNQIVHTVVGKTEPPNAVLNFRAVVENQNLTLRWDSNSEVDIAGYEIRVSDTSWGQSGDLYKGSATSVTVSAVNAANTWYVKAYDRSGNYSPVVSTSYTASAVPSVIDAASAVSDKKLLLNWNSPVTEFALAGYEVRTQDFGFGLSGEVYRGAANACEVVPLVSGTATWYIRAYDVNGRYSNLSATVQYTKPSVNTVSPVSYSITSKTVHLTFAEVNPIFGLGGYEVRTSDSNWGDAGELYRGLNTTVEVDPYVGVIWYVRAFDVYGTYSSTVSKGYVSEVIPTVANITHSFADTSLTSASVTIQWTDSAPLLGLDYYKIAFNGTVINTKSNRITVDANWIGDKNFAITAYDVYGFASAQTNYNITKNRPNPALNFKAQVIDNNVLLYWNLPVKTSLPIAHALLKVGTTWATAQNIGIKAGEFTSISELVGGEYTYWLAIVDTDNNESDPVKLTTYVAQPPDFVFYGTIYSTFSGTKVNAKATSEGLTIPVNLTENFQQHFAGNAWASPSAQVSAGYPLYIQPGVTSGSYEEIFDFATVVASSSVTVIYDGNIAAGNPTVTPSISVSLDGVTWVSYPGMSRLFATNFRYVKFYIDVTQAAVGDVYVLSALQIRLDNKLKSDSGIVEAVSTDTAGTVVNLNSEFVDVISITPSALASVARTCNYSFLDSIQSGSYSVTSNVATINITGHDLVAGQKVRLTPSTGGLPIGVYTVASVVNANSYLVNITTANTSGNLTTYPNSFRVFVFDSNGTRQSNTVSWTVRGS